MFLDRHFTVLQILTNDDLPVAYLLRATEGNWHVLNQPNMPNLVSAEDKVLM